jgi:hypothetical protein
MIINARNYQELVTWYIQRLVTFYAHAIAKAMKEVFRPDFVYSHRELYRLYQLYEIESNTTEEKHYRAKVIDTHDLEIEDEFLLRIPKEQLRRWATWPEFSEFLANTVITIGRAYSMGRIGYLTGQEDRLALGRY